MTAASIGRACAGGHMVDIMPYHCAFALTDDSESTMLAEDKTGLHSHLGSRDWLPRLNAVAMLGGT
jgi:hypothetical protein